MRALAARVGRALNERFTRRWAPDAIPSRLSAPVVSFSFDDFPRSALTVGGALLKAQGALGTYFAAGRFAGVCEGGIDYFTDDDVRQATEDGHEIGCHTFGHVRLPHAATAEIEATLAENAAYVRRIAPETELTSFAYPFGHVSPTRKAMMGRRFPVCRGIWPGVNAGRIDMAQLRAVPLEQNSFGKLDIDAFIEEAVRRNGWLVFFSHDISEAPSPYGYKPSELERVIRAVASRGVEILPIKAAAARVRFG
ncbi:MAG: polysaccharide deacetylase family protein [Hyphomonadaceae bacterium]|nr:polysaccharide deacetylase family protein [Hyphomonadaceae bacterium]